MLTSRDAPREVYPAPSESVGRPVAVRRRPCGCGQKDLREIAEASAELVQTAHEGAEPPQHY